MVPIDMKHGVSVNPLYPIVPNGISALFTEETYFWHTHRMAIYSTKTTVNLHITAGLLQ